MYWVETVLFSDRMQTSFDMQSSNCDINVVMFATFIVNTDFAVMFTKIFVFFENVNDMYAFS